VKNSNERNKILYFIRHGQTEYNRKQLIQGRGIDASLDRRGKLQAEAFYNSYKDEKFDTIYTSTLKRTYETIQPFLSDDYDYEKLSGLDEVSFGDFEGTPIYSAGNHRLKPVINEWHIGNYQASAPGGENPKQVLLRQKEALAHILSKKDEKKVLICTHSRAMKIFFCFLLNVELKFMDTYQPENTGVFIFEYDEHEKTFSLEMNNHTGHLV
jgi:broad specificity phosphatase PhoE